MGMLIMFIQLVLSQVVLYIISSVIIPTDSPFIGNTVDAWQVYSSGNVYDYGDYDIDYSYGV